MLSEHLINYYLPISADCGIAVVLRFGFRSILLIAFQVSDVLPFFSLNKFSKWFLLAVSFRAQLLFLKYLLYNVLFSLIKFQNERRNL